MEKIDLLERLIYEQRDKLENIVAQIKNLTDPVVVSESEKLDELLVQFVLTKNKES